jgi:hypothetical protein
MCWCHETYGVFQFNLAFEEVNMFHSFFKRVFAGLCKEPSLERPTGVRTFELTIVRFTPEPVSMTNTFSSGHAAAASLAVHTDAECFIQVSVWQDKYSLGDFLLWCSGEYARARIGEHRSHDATDPDSAFAPGNSITFRDDDGSTFTETGAAVLPRELAVEALRAWLIDLKHPSFFRWS